MGCPNAGVGRSTSLRGVLTPALGVSRRVGCFTVFSWVFGSAVGYPRRCGVVSSEK